MILYPFVNGPVNISRHYVLDIMLILLRDKYVTNTGNKIRHDVLASSLTWSGLPLVLYHLFKQTLYGCYFTDMVPGSCGNVQVIKSRHYMLIVLLGALTDNSVMKWWIKPDTFC